MNPRIVALINPIQNRLNMTSQSRACKKHLSRCGGSSGYAPVNQNNRQLRYPAGISGGTSAFNSQIENNEIRQSDTKNDVSNVLFRLTILRHGQTTANAKGIIQGQQEHWPLTNVGVMQARMAHEEFVRLANEKKSNFNYFWRAYSSDLFRAKRTAEIALGRDPKHPSSGVLMCQTEDLRLDERLREYSLGVREGRSVSISWQQAVSEWRKENNLDDERDESNWHQYMTTKAPSRESAKDVHRRTQSFIHNLVEEVREKWHSTKGASSTHQTLNNDPPNILLVSHGGCIKILLQSSLGFPEELIGKLLNGSLTEVDVLSSLSSDHDTKARTHDECGKTVIYDGEVRCCYRLGSRVNDIRHLEDHPMGLTQHHGHENDSLDALYGALGDDASVAMEK